MFTILSLESLAELDSGKIAEALKKNLLRAAVTTDPRRALRLATAGTRGLGRPAVRGCSRWVIPISDGSSMPLSITILAALGLLVTLAEFLIFVWCLEQME